MSTTFKIRSLLRTHRRALETMLAMNASAEVHPVQRRILDGLDAEARRYLARIAKHEANPIDAPFGTMGTFGPNGCAPAIRDICRQAEFHRIAGAKQRKAA